MRQLSIEERLSRIEEHVTAIRQMMEKKARQPELKPMGEEEREILTVKQVAQMLSIDANVIYSKCIKGDIPYFKIGKQYRFKKHEILNWVKSQKAQPDFSVDEFVDRYLQNNVRKS